MIPADETFDGTFPFTPHFSEAPGFRMHYVDEGAGEPIVLLHGEPTWGYLYRHFIPPLAEDHRVVVPDHMGFGKSETPQDREYTAKTHVENLAALIEELDLRDITLVIQDWGGPIGGCYTALHPERVKRLCLLNTVVPLMASPPLPDEPERTPWFEWVGDGYDDGPFPGRTNAVLGSLDTTILSVLKIIGFENMARWTKPGSEPTARLSSRMRSAWARSNSRSTLTGDGRKRSSRSARRTWRRSGPSRRCSRWECETGRSIRPAPSLYFKRCGPMGR